VSLFVKEFVQRKVAEQNRKPGGKKKKKVGAADGAPAAGGAAASSGGSGVSAAAMGLVNAAVGDSEWAKIPKKAGAKKKKPAKLDAGQLGFPSNPMALLDTDE
jgi:hypothetical protein